LPLPSSPLRPPARPPHSPAAIVTMVLTPCALVPTPHPSPTRRASDLQFALLTNRARNGSSLPAVWYAASVLSPTSPAPATSTHAAPLALWWPQCALSSPPHTTPAPTWQKSTNLPCARTSVV